MSEWFIASNKCRVRFVTKCESSITPYSSNIEIPGADLLYAIADYRDDNYVYIFSLTGNLVYNTSRWVYQDQFDLASRLTYMGWPPFQKAIDEFKQFIGGL